MNEDRLSEKKGALCALCAKAILLVLFVSMTCLVLLFAYKRELKNDIKVLNKVLK